MMIGLLGLFVKLSLFSLIAFGGVNALLPTLYDISVNQEKWIDADTFIHYFAIAQAAPGPNLLTVTLIGWNAFGLTGALLATLAVCWPSCILIFYLQRVLTNLRHIRWKKTIEYSAGALAVGLVLASACGKLQNGLMAMQWPMR
jgi:chromate transporter